MAWPASWKATCFLSAEDMPLLDFAGPAILLSIASSISGMPTLSLWKRTARIAASFKMLSMSAPENPTVRFAKAWKSTDGSILLFLA